MVSGGYFPDTRHRAGDRPTDRRRRLPDRRQRAGGCAEPCLLGVAIRPRPRGARPGAHGQRAGPHGGGRRTRGVRGHDDRRATARLRAHHAPRAAPAGDARGPQGTSNFDNRRTYWIYLFARLKAGVSPRTGRGRAQRAVSRDSHRRRAAAAAGDERGDAGPFPPAAAARRAGRTRTELDARRGTRAADAALRGDGARAGHCLREHRQPAARPFGRPRRRDGDPPVDRREPRAARSATPDRGVPAGGPRRHRWPDRRAVDAEPGSARCCRPRPCRPSSMRFDPQALLFTTARSHSRRGCSFGLFPALHSTRPDLVVSAQEPGWTAVRIACRVPIPHDRSRRRRLRCRWRSSCPRASSSRASSTSAASTSGLNAEHVVTFTVSPTLNGYTTERTPCAVRAPRRRVGGAARQRPDVTGAIVPVLAGNNWGNSVYVEGFESGPDTDRNSRFNAVGPAYFRTLEMPVLGGPGIHSRGRHRVIEGRDRERGLREEVRARPRRPSASTSGHGPGSRRSTSRSSAWSGTQSTAR